MYCKNCGYENGEFCINCGVRQATSNEDNPKSHIPKITITIFAIIFGFSILLNILTLGFSFFLYSLGEDVIIDDTIYSVGDTVTDGIWEFSIIETTPMVYPNALRNEDLDADEYFIKVTLQVTNLTNEEQFSDFDIDCYADNVMIYSDFWESDEYDDYIRPERTHKYDLYFPVPNNSKEIEFVVYSSPNNRLRETTYEFIYAME